jgi:DnaK suppressor protein
MEGFPPELTNPGGQPMGKNNMDKAVFAELREELTARRAELIDLRNTLKRSWQDLNEPASELEETASKEGLSREKQQRSESVHAEIRNIDTALTRMAEGDYGRCEACRRPIRVQRLRAVPWTRYCVKCAGMREQFASGPVEGGAVATGGGELTDDETREMIVDELRSDGRVETEELVISCEDGVVYLEGVLPSHAKHQVLLEIVHDGLDIEEVVDSIRIDRQPWERRERRPDSGQPDAPDAEALAGEEDGDVDAYTSLETGEPMAPPDRLVPENPGER